MESKEKELLNLKQSHIEKLNLLTALQEETNIIDDELRYQDKLRAKHSVDNHFNINIDLNRLQAISRQQQNRLKSIDNEIQALRMKVKPLRPMTFFSGGRNLCNYDQEFNLHNSSIEGPTESTQSAASTSTKSICHENTELLHKIRLIVERFLIRNLSQPLDADALKEYVYKISAYFVQHLFNYKMYESNENADTIMKTLKTFLPETTLRSIHLTDFVELFSKICCIFLNEDVDEQSIKGLLQSTLHETINAISLDVTDHCNILLCEFLREIFSIVPFDDTKKMEQLKYFMKSIREQSGFNSKEIDTERCLSTLQSQMDVFLIDDNSTIRFKRFVECLIKELKSK